MHEKTETVDYLRIGNLQILQAAKGYRFSLDPILLSHFAAQGAADRVVDLGTGSGVIPLLLARLTGASRLVGVELQSGQVDRAKRSVALNGLQDRIEIVQGDLRLVRQLLPASQADLVITNPPYRSPGSGRVAPDDERAAARHEMFGGLQDFVAAAGWLLKNRGRFVIISLAERLPELLAVMVVQGLEPKRMRMVHPQSQAAAKLVLVEGRKHARPGIVVEPPLYIYQDQAAGRGREYTSEVLEMYGEGGAGSN